MNKAELITDLKKREVKLISIEPTTTLNGGDKEYSFNTLIKTSEGFSEESYSIRVIDEGLDTENADYIRKAPPKLISREAQLKLRLVYLQSLGTVKSIDISKLGIPYARLKINGEIKDIAELDGELIVLDGE